MIYLGQDCGANPRILQALAKHAYNLSEPRGMGFLHYTPGDMTDEQAAELVRVQHGVFHGGRNAMSLDYIGGRCVKLSVFRNVHGGLYVRDTWPEHPEGYAELFKRCGITPTYDVPESVVFPEQGA